MCRALPPGGLIDTLELDPHHADVVRQNIAAAGQADRVHVHVGPAAETLERLVAAGTEPYDVVFIDADKPSNARYLRAALELSRPGTLVVVDNVVRGGAVVDPGTTDDRVLGSRAVIEAAAVERRVEGTVLQMVGSKGYDGMLVLRVVATGAR